ncbi:MAG: Crp/Fnr family transcriptional regulator [Polyangiaceae bacterium]
MGAAPASIESALHASPLFGALDPDAARSLAPHVSRRHFERGAGIWRAGEDATWMALITSGLVKIVQPGGAIIAILGPHETFGELAIVAGSTYWAHAVAATRELDVLRVDAAAVRAASQSSAQFARAMSRSLAAHGRALHEKIRIMSAGCVERRLATLLQHLLDRFGDELEDGSIVVPIALSRSELACLVGATIETTIRMMSRWQKEQIVSTTEEGFVVHSPQRLEGILGAHPGRLPS